MTIFRVKKISVLCVVLLAGCGQATGTSNPLICFAPPPAAVLDSEARTPAAQAEVTANCVHRWAYRLAAAKGPNLEIAKAVIGGCREALMKEGTLYFAAKEVPFTLVELNEFRSELDLEYSEMALFYVVQARAGNCEAL